MGKNISIGLIGCGLRGTGYISYMRKLGFGFTLEALADTNNINLEAANRDFADNKAKLFNSGEQLVKETDLDALIITTPNKFHRKPAISAIKKGIPFLLEKPIATSMEDLAAIWQAYAKRPKNIIVGFTLRFTPFYRAIKDILDRGVLGQILSINAEELMSDRLSMIFCRSQWRPDISQAGPLLLEKCCHDIDILNWISGSKAAKISSNSRCSFLTPGKGPERTCDKCLEEPRCRFSRNNILESFKVDVTETQTENHALYSGLIDGKCPYHIGSPYPDHQSVMIEYENGVLCNFTVAQAQPANRRIVHILGSEARLYGVLEDNYFTLFHRIGPNDEKPEVVQVHTDGSGHGGGDGILTTDYWNLIQGKPNSWRPGLKEGIESAIMCLVADKSVELERSINLSEHRNRVFNGNPILPSSESTTTAMGTA